MAERDDQSRERLRLEVPLDVRSASLTVLAVLAVVFAFYALREAFIPLVLAILVSYALNPLVTALHRLRIPRIVGAALVLAAIVGGVGVVGYIVQDEVAEIVNELPQAARRLRRSLLQNQRRGDGALDKVQQAATEIERAAAAASPPPPTPSDVMKVQIQQPPFRASEYLLWGSRGAAAVAAEVAMVLFLVYFLLISGDLYKRKLVRIAGPSLEAKQTTIRILNEITDQIERFLLVQVLSAAIVGVVTWLALWKIGLEHAAVWGIFAGVFNSIPYFGPIVVSGGLTIIAYMQFGSIATAVTVAAIALAITSLEGWLLMPALVGRAARMNHAAVFVGLLFWSVLWGVWGLLLATPILMVVKAICDRVENLQPVAELLGE